MENSASSHPIFHQDPGQWRQYIYRLVSVTTQDGREHIGWVYTVDPVSQTFVLAHLTTDCLDVELVVGGSIVDIRVLNDNTEDHRTELDNLFRPDCVRGLSANDLQQRKHQVKLWLEQNRLPVNVTGDYLSIAGSLLIGPPYEVSSCQGTNEIILERIQALLKNMPGNPGEQLESRI